jgi:hypothetical protein
VTLSIATLTPTGGVLAIDGTYWLAGTNAGFTRLYSAATTTPTALTLDAPVLPSASCAFSDPYFDGLDATKDLYVAFPLAGCAQTSLIAVGKRGLSMGAFYAAFTTQVAVEGPTLTPGGLTLLAATLGPAGRLQFGVRSAPDMQFSEIVPLPTAAFGAVSVRERQLVVRNDCAVAYLVAERAGGLGGTDLWKVDVLP